MTAKKTAHARAAYATTAISAAFALALAGPLPASAHVTVEPTSTAAGSYTVLTFSTSHGCDASPTTAIAIDIPEQISSVAPTVNPGWEISTVAADEGTAESEDHGEAAHARTSQVVYTAKQPLPDGLRDTFSLSLRLPDDAAGSTLAFPVVQTCEVGETRWDEIATDGEAEPEHPAPAVTVTAATGASHGHGGDNAAGEAQQGTGDDVLARGLGAAGLVVGVVGIVLAVASRRKLTT